MICWPTRTSTPSTIPLPNHLHVPWSHPGDRGRQARPVREADRPLRCRGRAARRGGAATPEAEGHGSLHVPPPSAVAGGSAARAGRAASASCGRFTRSSPISTTTRTISATSRDIGGGALMDIGCYCISLSRFIFEAEPHARAGDDRARPEDGVDRLASGVLEFVQGTSTFTCGTQFAPTSG